MKSVSLKSITGLLILMLCVFGTIQAQENPQSVCENNDCLPEIVDVKIDEPRFPAGGTYTAQRTQNFIAAYKKFDQVQSTYAYNMNWKALHQSSQLTGRNCMRHYQLETRFAHEYIHNPDFKA